MSNKTYTAFSDGSYVRVYDALTGNLAVTKQMNGEILTCVCAGHTLTLTVQITPQTKYTYVYEVPSFKLINTILIP